MATLTYPKSANAAWLAGAVGTLAMPDIVFGMLAEMFHLMFEVAHLLFEVFESALDHLVEHTFHTGTKDTQLIVFYLIVAMACPALYFLSRWAHRLLRQLQASLVAAILARKTSFLLYWAESANNKFKLIMGFHVALTAVVLFGF